MGIWDDVLANFDPFRCTGCGTRDGDFHRPGCREGLSVGEVADELWRAVCEDGTAVVTEEMVLRDVWERHKAGGAALMAKLEPARIQAQDHPRATMTRTLLEGYGMLRTTPARPLRVRVCPEPLGGPHWLTLLAQCAWLRGGIIAGQDRVRATE